MLDGACIDFRLYSGPGMNTLHHLGVPHSRGNRERFNGGCIRRHIKRGQSTVHLYCLLKRYDAIVVKEQIPVVVVSALSSMQSYQRGEVGSTAIHGGRRSANQRLLIFSVYTVSFNFHPFSCRVHRVRQIDRICCVGCSIVGANMAPKKVVEKVEAKQTLTAVLLADSFAQVCLPPRSTALPP